MSAPYQPGKWTENPASRSCRSKCVLIFSFRREQTEGVTYTTNTTYLHLLLTYPLEQRVSAVVWPRSPGLWHADVYPTSNHIWGVTDRRFPQHGNNSPWTRDMETCAVQDLSKATYNTKCGASQMGVLQPPQHPPPPLSASIRDFSQTPRSKQEMNPAHTVRSSQQRAARSILICLSLLVSFSGC